MAAKPKISFWDRNPPYAAAIACKLCGLQATFEADAKATKDTVVRLETADGVVFEGLSLILKYIARCGSKGQALYASDGLTACLIDQWLDFAAENIVNSSNFENVCAVIDSHLALRLYLVGHTVTLADLGVWGALQAAGQWMKVKKSGKLNHLLRWFDYCSELPEFVEATTELDPRKKSKPDAGKDGSNNNSGATMGGGDTGSFDIDLPDAAEGKVVMRFAPEPSGYLHIGHAKAALLNAYFASLYKGKLILRFDDTNPSKEKDEYVENIFSDIAAMGIKYDQLTYTSDYFPQFMDLAERLIKAGFMYADDTPVEQMREERMNGIESKCRTRGVEENMRVWHEMVKGSEEGLKSCMRFKMDMQNTNKALRDPVAWRCNLTHHWRTGHKYKVYPTYDCACPFVDAVEGVTHALRASEYKDREAQYFWILDFHSKVWPGLPKVHIWDFSRLNFVYTVLSKRKLKWFVETGRVDGWDDPRFPTVQGILRRGLLIETLKKFILLQGASKNVTYQEWDKIWTMNKQIIDPICPRHTAVEDVDKVVLHLTNGPQQPEIVTVPRHKKYPPAGVKATTKTADILIDQADAQVISENEEVTLMDWGNCIVRKIVKSSDGKVASMEGELHLEGSVKTTKLKLTWLANIPQLLPLQLVDFDYLINKKKEEEDDDFEKLVNEKTRFERAALGDANMRCLQRGDIIQLERKGYFRVDVPLLKDDKPIVLFSIPDGRGKKA